MRLDTPTLFLMTVVITFMVGLWIVWLITHAGAFTIVNNIFGSVTA